ncbi:MAG: hypothetical protein PVF83_13235 [Anaerolineales bacterium]|jgi:hypothetical protein
MPELDFIMIFQGKTTEQAKKLANGIDTIWAESFPHNKKDSTVVVGFVWEAEFKGDFSIKFPGKREVEAHFGKI